jgi:hypothetical protein
MLHDIMREKIFKVYFTKDSYSLNEEYDRLSDYEKEIISTILPDYYFEFNNINGGYTLYLIISPNDLDKYLKILENNLINYSVVDISDDILNGLDLQNKLKKYINIINNIRWSKFQKVIDSWIFSNLDIDLILDRINKVGSVKNLSKIEKKFLENYKV